MLTVGALRLCACIEPVLPLLHIEHPRSAWKHRTSGFGVVIVAEERRFEVARYTPEEKREALALSEEVARR